MKQTEHLKKIPVRPPLNSGPGINLHKLSLACFFVLSGWTLFECWMVASHEISRQSTRAIFLLLALLTTLVSHIRGLPAQNVLFAAALIAVIAGIVHSIGAASGIPFGSRFFLDAFGPRLFGVLPWAWPILWITFLLNSRGVARLILRPWRKTKNYGFRVIGLTCVFVVVLDLGFEPFSSRANHFWFWQTKRNIPAWFDAPWVNFFSVGVTALLILAFVTPWLINKKPTATKSSPDYQPLIVWLLMNFYFAFANGVAGLWLAVGVGAALSLVTAIFAIRGAKW